MKAYKNLASALVVLLLVSFDSFSQTKKTIYFHEIDDQASVFVDGKKVYESDVVGHLGGVEIELDLTKFIKTQNEKVTVKLYNAVCTNCASSNPWAINFEIREDGDEIDYQYEKGEGKAGKTPVYVYSFVWKDL